MSLHLTQQDVNKADALWCVQLVEINKRFNPNHEPAGSPEGGEFTSGDSGGGEKQYLKNPKAQDMKDAPVYKNNPDLFKERYGTGDEWYHGTTSDFKKDGGVVHTTTDWNSRLGTHFAADESTANEFASGLYSGKTNGGVIIAANLDIQNPKTYNLESDMGDDALRSALQNKVVSVADVMKVAHSDFDPKNIFNEGNGIINALRARRQAIADNFKSDLISKGHDGIIYGNVVEGGFGGKTAIAFHPEQINIVSKTPVYPEESDRSLRFNPNHEPAGSPEGGEFAPSSGGGNGLLTDDKELQGLAKDSTTLGQFYAKLNEKRAQLVIDKGKAIVESILARNPAIQEKATAVKTLYDSVAANNVLVDQESKWFQDYWAKPVAERPDKAVFKAEEDKFEKIMNEGLDASNAKIAANRDFTESLVKELRMEGVSGGNIDVNTGIESSTAGHHVELLGDNPSVSLAIKSFEHFTGAVGKVNAFTTDSNRSYFSTTQVPDAGAHADAGTVWFSKGVGQSTVWHEMGHWLEETTPGGKTAATAFLDYRTPGETAKPLAEITHNPGYRTDEAAKKDDFMDQYAGKVYTSGSTEITSMGMQHMQEDAAMFYRLDPEHFNFTLGMIQGRKEGGFLW